MSNIEWYITNNKYKHYDGKKKTSNFFQYEFTEWDSFEFEQTQVLLRKTASTITRKIDEQQATAARSLDEIINVCLHPRVSVGRSVNEWYCACVTAELFTKRLMHGKKSLKYGSKESR